MVTKLQKKVKILTLSLVKKIKNKKWISVFVSHNMQRAVNLCFAETNSIGTFMRLELR